MRVTLYRSSERSNRYVCRWVSVSESAAACGSKFILKRTNYKLEASMSTRTQQYRMHPRQKKGGGVRGGEGGILKNGIENIFNQVYTCSYRENACRCAFTTASNAVSLAGRQVGT